MYLSSSFSSSNVQFSSALFTFLPLVCGVVSGRSSSLSLRLDRSTKRAPRFELPCCARYSIMTTNVGAYIPTRSYFSGLIKCTR
ncbi:hypothetical protein BGY98DRAFT_201734 [Russula aff. rugulosa BPL654]|nr:hypothetical protein BGY98DRAFT_201734 [Russula aff. rugulosa BPL654]